MNRRKIRYLLFRLRTEAEGGAKACEMPEGFKESFQDQDLFKGWLNYGVTWDVDEDDPWKVVRLTESLARKWERTLEETVPVLLPDGTVVSAEEYARMKWGINNGD